MIRNQEDGVNAAIQTNSLRKVYPGARSGRSGRGARPEVVALENLDLEVPRGQTFGLLGPNGAGKTTTIAMLTTRALPTGGSARVAGIDCVEDPIGVRQRIGVVPQRANPDRSLSVIENLVYHATYFGIGHAEASHRAGALLEQFEMPDKCDAKIDALSGGQLQRLMIARALMHDPEVLFLDEPTVGLDPQVRLDLWEILRDLHRKGRTVVITTHYMEEADQLCDRVAILDHGKLLTADTPARLRSQAPGGTMIELSLDGEAAGMKPELETLPGVLRAEIEPSLLRVFSERGGEIIPDLISLADRHGRQVMDIHLMKPSLETLFIHLTGRKLS